MSNFKQSLFIEIFTNIIYIYALMQSSIMLGELTNGIIGPFAMFSYITLLLIIITSWMYQLTMDERYGKDSAVRTVGKMISCFLLLLCTNSMKGDWTEDFYPIITMLGCMSVVLLGEYGYEFFVGKKDKKTLPLHMGIIAVRCILLFVSLMFPYRFGIIAAGFGVWIGWIISSLFKGYKPPAFENAEAILESFALIVVMMLGSGAVRLTDYFTTDPFMLVSIPAFGIILTMGWFYLTEYDGLLDRNKILKSPENLYYFHYLMWIGIALIIAVFQYMILEMTSPFFSVVLLYIGLLLYFGGILSLTIYHKRKMKISIRMMYIYLGIYGIGLLLSAIFCSNTMLVMSISFIMAILVTGLLSIQKMAFMSRARKQ